MGTINTPVWSVIALIFIVFTIVGMMVWVWINSHMYLSMPHSEKWKEWYAWYPIRIKYIVNHDVSSSKNLNPIIVHRWRVHGWIWRKPVYWRNTIEGNINDIPYRYLDMPTRFCTPATVLEYITPEYMLIDSDVIFRGHHRPAPSDTGRWVPL